MRYANQRRGVYHRRNQKQFAVEGYAKNVVVFMAINKIARAVSTVPFKLLRKENELDDDHPLAELIARPNPECAWSKYLESVVAYYALTGNSYVELVKSGNYAELWPLRPDRTKVRTSSKTMDGWVYDCNGMIKEWDKDAEDFLHLKMFNPVDDFYGMSPLEAAAFSIDTHNEAGKWNAALLQNSAKPSGALVYKNEHGAAMSDKQREALKEELRTMYEGAANVGRPMLLENLDWQSMGMNAVDLDYVNGKNMSAREIASALGCPAQLLGIPGDSTYSNFSEARQSFYEDTVLPLHQHIMDEHVRWLGGDPAITVKQCTDDIPALVQKRQLRAQMLVSADWMTINEKRIASGLDPVSVPEADQVMAPAGKVPLGIDAEHDAIDNALLQGNDQ